MKYCSNCGEQIDEKAVICVKCGVPVNGVNSVNNSYNQVNAVPKQGHGAATASLILGIIGIIAAVITLIIAICVFVYYRNYTVYDYDYYYSTVSALESSVKIGICILLTFLPGILSLIGLPLGCFCKKGGPKIAGIVLNTITLAICVTQIILIMNA